MTTTPRLVAAGISTLSSPIPARPTTCSFDDLQLSGGTQQVLRHLGCTANYQCIIIPNNGFKFLRLQPGIYIDLDIRFGVEHFNAGFAEIITD
jgi:hypothetical protein